ncbi:MAG TPA: diguanylate cyclase [Variovorax sp.]|nr:diguanylate cyclase [Variovorax sp.]
MSPTDQENYEALLQFLYIAPIGLAQVGADGEIVMINPLCAQLLMPLSRDGGLANLFVALQDVAPDLRHRADAFTDASGMICDAMHLHVDAVRCGRKEAQVLSLSLLKLDAERLMAVLGDATQAVRRERELRQSQSWIHTIVTGLADYALVALDENVRCQDWNPGVERVTGFAQAQVLGTDYALFYPPEALDAARAMDRLHEADHSGWSLDEGWRQRADGTRYWGSCLIAPLQEPGTPGDDPGSPRGYSLILRDVSERREATDAMRRSLWSDHLTGLSNRRVLFEAAELEIGHWRRAPRALSVVMIDADHFKGINDRFGHAAGDAVLRHLATALVANFGAHDTVARLGGEEFVALLPGVDAEAAAAAAERLCRTVEAQPVRVGEHAISYTVSAGVATMAADVVHADALLQRADTAMYVAKALGRNRVECWKPGLRDARRTDARNGRD